MVCDFRTLVNPAGDILILTARTMDICPESSRNVTYASASIGNIDGWFQRPEV
jgi:hypothetical protein